MFRNHDESQAQARRAFLSTCGKFAAITPVVMTGMLSISKQSFAVATSGGGGPHGNNGYGNGSYDGIPGKSGGKGKKGAKGPITDTDR